jgi:hypothetical protein
MKIKDIKLTINAAQCTKCNDIVTSKHRHDFRFCKCGAVAVDGGLEYARRVGDLKSCIDLCETIEYEREEYEWERADREQREQRERRDSQDHRDPNLDDDHHRGYN